MIRLTFLQLLILHPSCRRVCGGGQSADTVVVYHGKSYQMDLSSWASRATSFVATIRFSMIPILELLPRGVSDSPAKESLESLWLLQRANIGQQVGELLFVEPVNEAAGHDGSSGKEAAGCDLVAGHEEFAAAH